MSSCVHFRCIYIRYISFILRWQSDKQGRVDDYSQRTLPDSLQSATLHDVPWCPMMCHDVPWCAVMCRDVPWCAMMCHDVPWCAMMCHDVPWYAMMCRDVPWCAVMCRDVISHQSCSQPPSFSHLCSLSWIGSFVGRSALYNIIYLGTTSSCTWYKILYFRHKAHSLKISHF